VEITNIRIYPFDTSSQSKQIRAFADVELDQVLVIRGVKIIESKTGGLFITMPSIQIRPGDFKDILLIKDASFGHILRERVLDAYRNFGACEEKQL
jgi:stage V sporulation protein G